MIVNISETHKSDCVCLSDCVGFMYIAVGIGLIECGQRSENVTNVIHIYIFFSLSFKGKPLPDNKNICVCKVVINYH